MRDCIEIHDSIYSNYQAQIDSLSANNTLLTDSILKLNHEAFLKHDETDIFGLPVEIVAIAIPVLIFALGQFLVFWRSQNLKKTETETFRRTVLKWISAIQEPITVALKNLDLLEKGLISSTDFFPVKYFYNQILADKLDSLDLKEMFKPLLINSCVVNAEDRDEMDTHFYQIVSQVSYLTRIEKEIPGYYKKYEDRINLYSEEWAISFRKLSETLTKISTDRVSFRYKGEKSLYMKILNIANYWASSDQKRRSASDNISQVDFNHISQNLIKPLIQEVEDLLTDDYSNHIAHELFKLLQANLMVINNTIALNHGEAEFFSGIKSQIKSANVKLLEAQNFYIKKSKARSLFLLK